LVENKLKQFVPERLAEALCEEAAFVDKKIGTLTGEVRTTTIFFQSNGHFVFRNVPN
jgi:hypothetical protein